MNRTRHCSRDEGQHQAARSSKRVLGFGAVLLWSVAAAAGLELQPPATASDLMAAEGGGISFADVTESAGAAHYYTAGALPMPERGSHVGGVAWGDIDGDGWLDLFLVNDSTRVSDSRPKLLRNVEGRRFENVTEEWGVSVALRGGGASFADYDNDGDPDLYLATAGPNYLFRNDGWTFTEVGGSAGVDDRGRGHSGTWADYDRDGDLDLYVANWDPTLDSPQDKPNARDRLYRNEGDGTFTDVAPEILGIEGTAAGAFVGGWFDYDNDGDPDLLVINDSRGATLPDPHLERHILWRNDGAGPNGLWRFTDVTVEAGVDLTANGMGVAFGDLDLDGDLDVYTSDILDTFLMRNDGAAGFVDVTEASGTRWRQWTWGTLIFDVDNDGLEDIFVPSGMAPQRVPSALFRNRGGGEFDEIGYLAGVADPEDNRAAAFADFDNDGDLDLYVPRFGEADGRYSAHGAWGRLYRNDSLSRAWIGVTLQGRASNRQGVGTRVIATLPDGERLMREATAGIGVGSSSDPRLYLGLGDVAKVDLEIRWPSGTVDRTDGLATRRHYVAVEGNGVRSLGAEHTTVFLPIAAHG